MWCCLPLSFQSVFHNNRILSLLTEKTLPRRNHWHQSIFRLKEFDVCEVCRVNLIEFATKPFAQRRGFSIVRQDQIKSPTKIYSWGITTQMLRWWKSIVCSKCTPLNVGVWEVCLTNLIKFAKSTFSELPDWIRSNYLPIYSHGALKPSIG